MNQREKILAVGVGVTLGLLGLNYGINTVRSSISDRQALVDAARSEADSLQLQITKGMVSQRKVNDLKSRSLPANPQILVAGYGDWLTELGKEVGLRNIRVTKPERPVKAGKAYTAYKFSLQGSCRTDQLIDLLTKYYDKNYLHTITSLKINVADLNAFDIQLDSQAVALRVADQKQLPSSEPSGRLAKTAAEYKATIIGRNPFATPNLPPKLATSSRQEVKRGDAWNLKLEGSDPENQPVSFELVSTDAPAGLRFSSRSGEFSWQPAENGEYQVVVRATDAGLPAKSSEHKLTLLVIDPPPPPAPKVEEPTFDAATQSRVSAVLGGRKGPEAWIRSMVDGKTIELAVGDDFELGTIKAKVVSINLKESFVELETEGRRWTVGMDSTLTEAFQKSQVD